MLKKFIHGLIFGAGFSIALVVIWSVYMHSVLPKILMESQPTPELSKGKPADVVTTEPKAEREFRLHPQSSKMEIPDGGGIISLAIIEAPMNSKRPSSFQVWLTEHHIFKILTDEETPEVEEVQYPDSDPIDYMYELVRKNAGFRKGNSTMAIIAGDVQRLKNGLTSSRGDHLNGTLRITTDGVVFFVPNEYGT